MSGCSPTILEANPRECVSTLVLYISQALTEDRYQLVLANGVRLKRDVECFSISPTPLSGVECAALS